MSTSRRYFLAVAAGSAAKAWQGTPSDQIRLGQIGCGGRSQDHMTELMRSTGRFQGRGGPQAAPPPAPAQPPENAALVAACDVWKVNLDRKAADIQRNFGVTAKKVTKYQELLAMKDVDAVLIATPDMTHPRILADAVAAGKDVYVEKPFAVDFADGKMAWQAVKKSKQVVQVGTQRRSDPVFIAAAKYVQDGVLGKVTRVTMEVNYHQQRWRRDFHDVKPEDVDWEAFQFHGKVKGPFNAQKLREWQLFEETTNGIAGLWMCHLIDLVPWYLKDPYPKAASTMGGVYLWKDGRQTADVFQSMVEYNECLVSFTMTLTNGYREYLNMWYGTKGTMDIEARKITGQGSRDPDKLAQDITFVTTPVESHMTNFLRCVKSRETPRASVDAGFQHAVAGCMAGVSLKTGKKVNFDAARMEIV